MVKWLATFAILLSATGCFRNGYECATEDDCFNGESCVSGTCTAPGDTSNNQCRPESDAQICAAQTGCQALVEVTDSCGVSRSVTCDCADACVPETVDELCEAAGAECGPIEAVDSCSDQRTPNCGLCEGAETCVNNACSNCVAEICPIEAECGAVVNSCGDVTECGSACPNNQICLNYACADPVLTSENIDFGDRFGEEVKRDGDWLLVGAPGADYDGFTNAGAIVVFRKIGDSWVESQFLKSSVPADESRFGANFDVRDGLLFAPSGSYLVVHRLLADLFTFTSALSLVEPIVDIGVLDQDDALVTFVDSDSGDHRLDFYSCQATCSREGVWEVPNQVGEVETLSLGAAIDTAGSRAIIGAPTDNITRNDTDFLSDGSIYILDRTAENGNWEPTGWTGAPLDFYLWFDWREAEPMISYPPLQWGKSVAINDEGFAIAGAPNSTPEGSFNDVGETFFYAANERSFQHPSRLRGTNLGFQRCGYSVALTGSGTDTLGIVSCLFDGNRGDNLMLTQEERTSGMLRVYTWTFDEREWKTNGVALQAPNNEFYDHFGWVVEGSPDLVFVGAPGRSNDTGEVFIFTDDQLRP